MAEEMSLELIGRSLRDVHEEMRTMRTDIRDVRSAVIGLMDQSRRTRDDLELLIRSEMLGRAAHFETRYERELGDIRDRLQALEQVGR